MVFNINNLPKNLILSSPESVRKKIIDRIVEYEELYGVDLSKTNFFSYIIDVLSMLSSDIINALTLSKQESYLVTANFPSSVYNWSAYLGYTKGFAKPAEVEVLLGIYLDFKENVSFKIDYFTNFKANDIVYTNSNEYYVFTFDYAKKLLFIKAISENTVRDLKVIYRDNIAYTVLKLQQKEKLEEEKVVPYDLQPFQPYSFTLQFPNKLADIRVFIKETKTSVEEEWTRAENYFEMGTGAKKYFYKYETNNVVRIMFGNDIFGKQPKPGSIIRVVLYHTKADKGSVIANSITKMDRIMYTDSTNIRKEVSVTLTNVVASDPGERDDTLREVKEKAIARFRARQRLVTQQDYEDLKHIVSDSYSYSLAKAILKRSDVKTNEICLFIVLPKEYKMYVPETQSSIIVDETSIQNIIPIPTDSITTKISSDVIDIKPFSVFLNEENQEFICPFGFIRDSETFGYFYYIIRDISLVPDVENYNQIDYPLSFMNLEIKEKDNYEELEFILSFYNLNNIVNMDNLEIKLFLHFVGEIKGPFDCEIDNVNKVIRTVVDINEIYTGNCVLEFHVRDMVENIPVALIKSAVVLKKYLKEYMYAILKDLGNEYLIYDVPCILKEYIDEMSDDEKKVFETNIIQKMIYESSLSNYRMLNTSVNLKFAKTFGKIKNYQYNKNNKGEVKDILNVPPDDAQIGDRYLVGMEPVGIWAGHANKIALRISTGWYFFKAAPGDIIYVEGVNARYTFSGNANSWIRPSFEIPYKVEVYVYLNSLEGNETEIVKKIKNHLLFTLGFGFGLDSDQHRSIMYKAVQELGNFIDHCEIKIPEVDIEFKYKLDELSKEDLKRYVPEYIYTDEEHISVFVQYV